MSKSMKTADFGRSGNSSHFSTKKQELALVRNRGRRLKWGGARNFANRVSHSVSLSQAQSFILGIDKAVVAGKPLNVHKTINFSAMGIMDEHASQALSAFIKLVRDYLAKRGEIFPWAWMRENPLGGGSHAHVLMHVPPELASRIRNRQYHWLNRIERDFRSFKPRKRKGRIHTSRIGGTLNSYQSNPKKYQENLMILTGYLLKGSKGTTLRKLGFNRRAVDCGPIIGKRVGRWQQRRPHTATGGKSSRLKKCLVRQSRQSSE